MKTLLRFYAPFIRRRRGILAGGSLAALGLVGLRLALPWPLAHMLKPWLKRGDVGSGSAWQGALLFFALFVALGLCDYLARVAYARFAVELVRDLRASAAPLLKKRRGDFLARMIGDTARLKEGLKGFLIHVATNGLLCLGLVVTLAFLNPLLGLVFGCSLLGIGGVTAIFVRRVHLRARSLRKREGRLAEGIHERARRAARGAKASAAHPQVKPSRAVPKASLSVLQGWATWAVHAALALAILACLALAGPGGPRELSEEGLIVFMTYVLHTYHPIVRLARQLTRTGKLLASAERVREALEGSAGRGKLPPLPHLERGLTWCDFAVRAGHRCGGGLRLGPLDLFLQRGERVAVIGPCGAGKSTLLASVQTRQRAKTLGQLHWDACKLSGISTKQRAPRVGGAKTLEDTTRLVEVDVIVLDDALEGVEPGERQATLEQLFAKAKNKLLLISMRRPFGLELFDRVVALEAGRIVGEVDR